MISLTILWRNPTRSVLYNINHIKVLKAFQTVDIASDIINGHCFTIGYESGWIKRFITSLTAMHRIAVWGVKLAFNLRHHKHIKMLLNLIKGTYLNTNGGRYEDRAVTLWSCGIDLQWWKCQNIFADQQSLLCKFSNKSILLTHCGRDKMDTTF